MHNSLLTAYLFITKAANFLAHGLPYHYESCTFSSSRPTPFTSFACFCQLWVILTLMMIIVRIQKRIDSITDCQSIYTHHDQIPSSALRHCMGCRTSPITCDVERSPEQIPDCIPKIALSAIRAHYHTI